MVPHATGGQSHPTSPTGPTTADTLGGWIEQTSTWLAANWPFVREHLPSAPARVLEIGCGPLGGFVPALELAGYDAVGIDPEAPDGPAYRRTEFENHAVSSPVDAVVASASLHHVDNLAEVLDRVRSAVAPGAPVIVIEWAHERFDEPTARWCLDRLAPDEGTDGWLHRHRERWQESGQPWDVYFQAWACEERLQTGSDIVTALQARFDTRTITDEPYFFADLDGVPADQERAAIDSGLIQATGIRYVGQA
jgi:SAM-dependent methyltransferase